MNEKKEMVLAYLIFIPLLIVLMVFMYPTNKPTKEANLFIDTNTARFGWHEVRLYSLEKKAFDTKNNLVLLHFTITNHRKYDSILYNEKNIYLRGHLVGSGLSAERVLFKTHMPSSTLGSGTLKPGESVEGVMGFLVPLDEKKELQFRLHAVRGNYTILRINMNPEFMKTLMTKGDFNHDGTDSINP